VRCACGREGCTCGMCCVERTRVPNILAFEGNAVSLFSMAIHLENTTLLVTTTLSSISYNYTGILLRTFGLD
jgi:hypothetical protein